MCTCYLRSVYIICDILGFTTNGCVKEGEENEQEHEIPKRKNHYKEKNGLTFENSFFFSACISSPNRKGYVTQIKRGAFGVSQAQIEGKENMTTSNKEKSTSSWTSLIFSSCTSVNMKIPTLFLWITKFESKHIF